MNFVIIGKPGSGKGTLSEYVQNKYDFHHISTGDLFRKHIQDQSSEFGKRIRRFMENNEFVPDELTYEILTAELLDLWNQGRRDFIFDGFPRTADQVEKLDEILLNLKLESIKFALLLKVSNKTASDRLSSRFDESQRKEDGSKRAICKRLIDYRNLTEPVVEEYTNQLKLYLIDATTIPQIVNNDFDNLYKYFTSTYTRSM